MSNGLVWLLRDMLDRAFFECRTSNKGLGHFYCEVTLKLNHKNGRHPLLDVERSTLDVGRLFFIHYFKIS